MTTENSSDLLAMTADIVSAHVAANSVAVSDLPNLIASVHKALAGLGAPVVEPEVKQEPAVSIRSSVKPDSITCLDCGKKFKMMKRHLMTDHDMTQDQYRAKWQLPASFPMVAPNYAAARKELALKIGLGRKAKVVEPAPVAAPAPAAKKAAKSVGAADAASKPARKRRKAKEPVEA